jgi:hypothetical protein
VAYGAASLLKGVNLNLHKLFNRILPYDIVKGAWAEVVLLLFVHN